MEEVIWEQYTVTLQKVSSARSVLSLSSWLAAFQFMDLASFGLHSFVFNLAEVGSASLELAGTD